jgi:site-specific recombinase XerC
MTHQTKTGSGTLAHIRIDGVLYRKHFRKGTDPVLIKQWLLATELRYRGKRTRRSGRFDDDAKIYLQTVTAMPSYADRKTHITEWIAIFGSQYRHTITPAQIAAQLSRWRTEPRTVSYTRRGTSETSHETRVTLSASSVNKRRTALMHLFTVLDGKSAPNPVKDVPKYREPDAVARGLPYVAIAKLWTHFRDTPTRARLQMMAYVGLTHRQIATLTRDHIDTTAKTIQVPGRAKGHGSKASVRPLTPLGLRACKAMIRTKAWGTFSRSTVHREFRAACAKVPALAAIAHRLTPYDLRHSFGTEVFRRSGDIRATQVLMGHSTPVLTNRYTLGAVDARVAAAIAAFTR